MQSSTGVRVVSAAAVVAALVAGVGGALGTLWFLSWGPPSGVVQAGAVLAGIAGVVVLVAALRTRDRRALAFAVSVLAFALMWVGPAWAVGVLLVVVQGALVAFGVLTSRDERGAQRVLGRVVVAAAAGWFVAALLLSNVPFDGLSQEALGVVLSLPALLQTVAYLAAAVLVAVPLLRPVGRGVGALWASAEVR